jgi:hypothetical protein
LIKVGRRETGTSRGAVKVFFIFNKVTYIVIYRMKARRFCQGVNKGNWGNVGDKGVYETYGRGGYYPL